MATSDGPPISVPNVTLAVARQAQPSGFIDIDYTLDQVQAIFAAMNTVAAPADAIWASALAPDQSDAELTQDGSESNPYSVRRAIYSATPSKHVLLKDDGVYSQVNTIQTRGQFSEDTYIQPSPNIIPWSMTQPTSLAEKIVIRGEPGTCPSFDCTSVETAIDIAMDFLEVSHIRFNNARIALASNNQEENFSSAAQGTYLHHVCGEFHRQNGGAKNVGFLKVAHSPGERSRIEYNFVKGNNSTTNQNNTCLFLDYNAATTVKGNYFYGVIPQVVYFKHGGDYAGTTAGGGGVLFENNYCGGDIRWAHSGATIRNNIVTGDLKVEATGGGKAADQDYNLIDKNTIIGDLILSSQDWTSDNNSVKNNIARSLRYQVDGAGSTIIDPSTNTNASNYNLINAADDGQRFLWGSQFASPAQFKTLSEWRAYISLDLNSTVQANQLKGLGTYAKLADFELVNGSVGLTLSDTGGAVGADASLVGIQ